MIQVENRKEHKDYMVWGLLRPQSFKNDAIIYPQNELESDQITITGPMNLGNVS